jgi:hypothetical protein
MESNMDGQVQDPGAALGTDNVAEPQVIEIADENALIKAPGLDKPVKYSEHVKGFQSQFTKASQRAAQLEKQLQERDARLKQIEAQQAQAARQTQNQGQNDVYAALEALPYLDGKQAAEVVRGIASELQQRDQFLAGMARYIKQMEAKVSQLYENHTTSNFDSKITKVIGDLGYGPEFTDLAKEIYLAYEGDDLDAEFPNILKQRVDQVEQAIEARKRAALERNRQNRFVPGKGGQAGPNKPLQFKGNESAKDIAETLFATFQGSGT